MCIHEEVKSSRVVNQVITFILRPPRCFSDDTVKVNDGISRACRQRGQEDGGEGGGRSFSLNVEEERSRGGGQRVIGWRLHQIIT